MDIVQKSTTASGTTGGLKTKPYAPSEWCFSRPWLLIMRPNFIASLHTLLTLSLIYQIHKSAKLITLHHHRTEPSPSLHFVPKKKCYRRSTKLSKNLHFMARVSISLPFHFLSDVIFQFTIHFKKVFLVYQTDLWISHTTVIKVKFACLAHERRFSWK